MSLRLMIRHAIHSFGFSKYAHGSIRPLLVFSRAHDAWSVHLSGYINFEVYEDTWGNSGRLRCHHSQCSDWLGRAQG